MPPFPLQTRHRFWPKPRQWSPVPLTLSDVKQVQPEQLLPSMRSDRMRLFEALGSAPVKMSSGRQQKHLRFRRGDKYSAEQYSFARVPRLQDNSLRGRFRVLAPLGTNPFLCATRRVADRKARMGRWDIDVFLGKPQPHARKPSHLRPRSMSDN